MAATTWFNDFKLEEAGYVEILTNLMKHVEHLQNQPPKKIPQEELAADEVVSFLSSVSGANGPLVVKKCTYRAGRSNVVVSYPSANPDAKSVSFVGSHMDVVSAAPEDWSFNPFELTRDGDNLRGRGVTDCLGHVAMLSCFMKDLATAKPALDVNVYAIFIANEEASEEMGIGVDELAKQGELKVCKSGPLFWVDSADMGPTLATAGALAWEITIKGKKFHSGLPHKGINAVELGAEVVKHLQTRFYQDFGPHPKDEEYKFVVGSSMKPTQFNTQPGPNNQIPQSVTISGDIRVTPFYDIYDVMKTVEKYMAELDVTTLPSMGASKYSLPSENGLKGVATFKWLGHPYPGCAADLSSPGYKAILAALNNVLKDEGGAKPFSLTGSLPLIADLQADGFDVQMCGFGKMDAYHAVDEYSSLKDMAAGYRVVAEVVGGLNVALPK